MLDQAAGLPFDKHWTGGFKGLWRWKYRLHDVVVMRISGWVRVRVRVGIGRVLACEAVHIFILRSSLPPHTTTFIYYQLAIIITKMFRTPIVNSLSNYTARLFSISASPSAGHNVKRLGVIGAGQMVFPPPLNALDLGYVAGIYKSD